MAVNWSVPAQLELYHLAKRLKLSDLVPPEKYHTTILFSKKYDDKVKKNDKIYNATLDKYEIFKTSSGKNALVVTVKSDELSGRHGELMDKYDLTYDYPTYIPHITLSYDCKDFEIGDKTPPKLTIISKKEYLEDLDMDWKA